LKITVNVNRPILGNVIQAGEVVDFSGGCCYLVRGSARNNRALRETGPTGTLILIAHNNAKSNDFSRFRLKLAGLSQAQAGGKRGAAQRACETDGTGS
jgi:hypothetical protein